MQLTIDIKESAVDKILYFLHNLKDVKILDIKKDGIDSDIEVVLENDEDYKYLLKGREELKNNPQNFVSMDEVEW